MYIPTSDVLSVTSSSENLAKMEVLFANMAPYSILLDSGLQSHGWDPSVGNKKTTTVDP